MYRLVRLEMREMSHFRFAKNNLRLEKESNIRFVVE
jgi:hypothetical protein